jgi:nicotinamide riboside transporter PnuC
LVVVVVVVVVAVVVVVVIVTAPAFALCSFEFLMTLVGLLTVFAVTLDGVAQFFFGLMDAPFAFVVAIGVCRHR